MNRYTKLIKTLKESPTNSMGGVYSLNDPGFRVGAPDPAKKFLPDIDGNFTDGIPGNPGDPFYLRPQGYWDGGSDWTTEQIPDASQDYLVEDPTGKSTSDLIAEDGTVKTFLPPNSRSFILGPLVDGYVQNHGYDNYSNIGYIQKDTRQFVLLARIQGQFTTDSHSAGARVWDGTAEQLTIYNSNFTLEMAEWFRDQITAGTFTNHVPYFYSGGVPQQQLGPGECPNCPPNMFGGAGPGTNPGGGFGQGGPGPKLGNQQGPSQGGNQVGAGGPFPGSNPNQNNQNNNNENETPPPPPPPPEEPKKPKGSLLAGFAAIDSAMAMEAGLTGAFMLGTAIAWIIGQLLSIGQSVVGNLLANFTWTSSEISALNNYASQRANQIANTMSTELSNEEWERQAEQGRQQDAQDAKEANERSRQAEEERKRAEESGDQERIDRAREAERNAQRNQERVRSNNSRNRQQRAKERRERGLTQQGGQGRQQGAKINERPFSEGLVSVKRLISEQESGTGTITAHTDGGDVTVNIGSNSNSSSSSSTQSEPPTEMTGGGRVVSANYLNPTIAWLKGESIAFAGGYVRGVAENGINSVQRLFQGTNISPTQVMNSYREYVTYEKQATEAWQTSHDYWFDTAHPAINNLIDQISVSLSAPGEYTWGDFYGDRARLDKIDTYFAEADRLERVAMNLSHRRQSASNALGRYVMYGRLLTRQEKDPFSLDDPNVGSEKQKKDKDKQIQDQIDKLMQENSELAQAQALNKLKALGWGALMAGAVVVGAVVLAKPAIVGALGVGTVRMLKSVVKSKPPLKPKPQYPTGQPKPDSGTGPWTSSSYNPNKPGGGPARKRFPVGDSYEPNRRKKLLSEIRKPVKVKEAPTKYKMNFSGKYSSQNTPDKTASQTTDELASRANARGQQWRSENKRWSGYETTERMNIIHDRVGHGSQYWDMMLDEAKEKNNWRSREVQEELNKIAHEKAMLKENPDFRSPFGNLQIDTAPTTPKNKKNFDAVTRIKNMAADKPTQKMMSQITPEYPSKPPTVPDEVTGLHPKLKSGENASAYYKRLDPTSADSMPDAAYPQIDDLKNKARKKAK